MKINDILGEAYSAGGGLMIDNPGGDWLQHVALGSGHRDPLAEAPRPNRELLFHCARRQRVRVLPRLRATVDLLHRP